MKPECEKIIKFAFVGCGRITRKHADTIVNHIKNAQLVSICDIIKEKATFYGKKYNIPWYTDYHKMLREQDIDVVNILTESGNHAKHTIDVVKNYQKHIVVEKPMALKLSDADRMIHICNKHNVKLFVVKQNRCNLPVIKLKEAIDEGRIGKFVMGTVRVRWCRTQEYYDQDFWRGTRALDGGIFANQASHHIDLLLWLLGDVDSVFAKNAVRLVDIETEDTGVAILKFQNGALGVVEATVATRPKDLEGSISILGEKGTVEIGGFAVNQIKVWNFVDRHSGDEEVLNKFSENPPDVYGFGHIEYLKNVCRSILRDEKALVDGVEARKSLQLINAFYKSIETGKEIFLHPMKI